MYLIRENKGADQYPIAVCEDLEIAKAYAKIKDGFYREIPFITDKSYIQRAKDMITEFLYVFSINNDIDNGEIRLAFYRAKKVEPNEKKEDIYDDTAANIYIYREIEEGIDWKEEDAIYQETKRIAWKRVMEIKAKQLGL